MIKKVLAFLLCICSLFCMTAVFARSETGYVTVTFADEVAESAFYALKGSALVYTDSYKAQLEPFELRVYNVLESNIETMKLNKEDKLEVSISGMPKAHHGNDDELLKLALPLFTAIFAFEFDHPELFWFSKFHAYTYSYKTSDNTITNLYVAAGGTNDWRSDAFPTNQSVTDAEKKFNDEVNKILAGAKDMGVYGKLDYFNSYIIDNCTYNPKVSAGADYTTLGEMPWCSYSGMVKQTDENKFPVCEGYSKAFKVLCDKAGIKCALIAGKYKGQAHMWSMVNMINGLWFYVDPTFNDVEENSTKYFLRGSSMEQTHKANPNLSPSCRALTLPVASKYDYTKAVGDSLGDANRDDKINTSDAATVLRHAAGVKLITDTFTKNCADFNCDSKVNTADAAAILRYCAGM